MSGGSRLEFAKCCGTVCDKVLAFRQVEKLVVLWRALRTPLQRFHDDRVCYIKDEEEGPNQGQILGVFIPISTVNDLYNDKKSAPK